MTSVQIQSSQISTKRMRKETFHFSRLKWRSRALCFCFKSNHAMIALLLNVNLFTWPGESWRLFMNPGRRWAAIRIFRKLKKKKKKINKQENKQVERTTIKDNHVDGINQEIQSRIACYFSIPPPFQQPSVSLVYPNQMTGGMGNRVRYDRWKENKKNKK